MNVVYVVFTMRKSSPRNIIQEGRTAARSVYKEDVQNETYTVHVLKPSGERKNSQLLLCLIFFGGSSHNGKSKRHFLINL